MNIEEAKANIGKEVILLETSKPFYWSDGICSTQKQTQRLFIGGIVQTDGDVILMTETNECAFHIFPEHIMLKEKSETNKLSFDNLKNIINLRHSILKSNPNRSLDEMKAIENWILGIDPQKS